MITDFQQFGAVHLISLFIPCILGLIFIKLGLSQKNKEAQKKLSLLLALLIIGIRGSRYIMDIFYGSFDWFDLLSLQVCHIDLILLIICLIKPMKGLYNFNFLVGIPMGIAVALMPGVNHPAPGLPRAILFIMSHMMLVVGAVYLTVVENMKPGVKYFLRFALIGNLGILSVYFINILLSTNYLYIMYPPEGTVIKLLSNLFGWPGYVFVMDGLALSLMLLMLGISQPLMISKRKAVKKEV